MCPTDIPSFAVALRRSPERRTTERFFFAIVVAIVIEITKNQ
jgi:hypothetical protein